MDAGHWTLDSYDLDSRAEGAEEDRKQKRVQEQGHFTAEDAEDAEKSKNRVKSKGNLLLKQRNSNA